MLLVEATRMKWSCEVHEGWACRGSSNPNESALAAFLVRSIKSVIERTEDPEYKLFAKSEDDKRSTTSSSSEPEHEKKNKPRRSRIIKSVVEKNEDPEYKLFAKSKDEKKSKPRRKRSRSIKSVIEKNGDPQYKLFFKPDDDKKSTPAAPLNQRRRVNLSQGGAGVKSL